MNEKKVKYDKSLGKLCPLQILVAEDSLTHQEIMKSYLEAMGFQPTVVENGKAAISAAAMTHYDLVLMDILMPEMDGFEAMDTIRYYSKKHDTDYKQPYITAITNSETFRERSKDYDSQFDDYLPKSFDETALAHVLLKAFKHKRNVTQAVHTS